jgi:AbrB family looped-hinge helix DNA binding protein
MKENSGDEFMDTARLSTKGQVTIPIGIRRRLGLNAGENVSFIEVAGHVFITSERRLGNITPKLQIEKQVDNFPNFEPEHFLPKDKRREILATLYGSIDDPTLDEPFGAEIESPRDWEMIN